MKVAKCALRAFFQDCLHIKGWTVFGELRIAPPQTLPLVLSREQVAMLLRGDFEVAWSSSSAKLRA
jgi:hypothetical protein